MRRAIQFSGIRASLVRDCLPALFVLLSMIFTLAGARPATAVSSSGLPPYISGKFTDDLPSMRKRKVVRALVTFSRSGFWISKGKAQGYVADLLAQYEKFLNKGTKAKKQRVQVVYVPVAFDDLIPSLLAGKGDFIAYPMTITPDRERKVSFVSGRKMKVNEVVVSRKETSVLDSLDDLSDRRVYVLRGSSFLEHLKRLNHRLEAQGRKPARIEVSEDNLVQEDILELLDSGVIDLTVADDYVARLWSEVLSEIEVHEELTIHAGGYLGLAVRKDNPKLQENLQTFVETIKKGTMLGNMLFKRYYKDTRWIRNPLAKKEKERFGRYVDLFRRYGEQYGFDYLALAAQGYQESGLDQGKRGRFGAVGVMQMLPRTASDPNVGINDITSAANNIHAAVKYLAFLRDRYFSGPQLTPPDRLAFVWAAYNAGPARVAQMRERAKQQGLDPDRWFENVEYAALELVGQGPVRYVANIYKYYVAYRLMEDMLFAGSTAGPPG